MADALQTTVSPPHLTLQTKGTKAPQTNFLGTTSRTVMQKKFK